MQMFSDYYQILAHILECRYSKSHRFAGVSCPMAVGLRLALFIIPNCVCLWQSPDETFYDCREIFERVGLRDLCAVDAEDS